MADTSKPSKSGVAHWGDKTLAYAKKLGRESVEKHTNTSVLYFEIDVARSKKNFYGELLVKKFVNPKGIEVTGVIEIKEGGDVVVEDIPNKLTTLKISCFASHLKEIGIEPKLGDYFATKNRIYFIWNKSIQDANSVSVGVDRESVFVVYDCVQADDEGLFPGLFGTDDGGTSNDITGNRQEDGQGQPRF